MSTARSAPAGRPSQRARRSSTSSPRRGAIRWDRLARISLLVVLALILLSFIGPATKYIEAWQLSHKTRDEVVALQGEHKQLKQRLKQLHNPTAIEQEARKLGMAKPGEKVYVIKGLPRKQPK